MNQMMLMTNSILQALKVVATMMAIAVVVVASSHSRPRSAPSHKRGGTVAVHQPAARDTSRPLPALVKPDDAGDETTETVQRNPAPAAPIVPPVITSPPGAAAIEQKSQGTRAGATLVESFDGLGVGFEGPHGTATLRNPSDNSLAVGPNHIFQIVNTRMAIFTKKGKQFPVSGKALYGPVPTNTIFRGFGGACEAMNNGDAVVRYDQLADRWLVVMPTFRRGAVRPDQPKPGRGGDPAQVSVPAQAGQPGPPVRLFSPPPQLAQPPQPRGQTGQPGPQGPYSMCYAISTGSDPFGPYYRYEFLRPLFPDYPRPAVWPDGYYTPTSTGDEVIQKHACVVDRGKMLKGETATEQCVVIDGVNFLNNADLDGKRPPPKGAPNIMMAAGGTQLKKRSWRTMGSSSGSSTLTGRTRLTQRSLGRRRSPSRLITICVMVSLRTVFRSRGRSGGSTRRATRSWRDSSIGELVITSQL